MRQLSIPHWYAVRARRMLIESAVALLIAIALPGANALNTAYSFVLGAILFGGALAVLVTVVSVAVVFWRRRGRDPRPVVVLVDGGSRAWWWPWTAIWVVFLSLAYLAGGPQFMAWLAGSAPGTMFALLVSFVVVRRVQAA